MLPGDVTLDYLAEGAANIIYKFTFSPSPPLASSHVDSRERSEAQTMPLCDDPIFKHRLLRLRKALPSSSPNEQACAALHKAFYPLFPESLVTHDLVRLPLNLLRDANIALRALEITGGRSQKRHGLYLVEDEPYGVLVTDMTPNTTEGEVLMEFKPKWLVQSHSAPEGWKRCRTCALRAQKNAIQRVKGQREEVGLCPLDLASLDQARVRRAVSFIVTANHAEEGRDLSRLRERLTSFLLESTIIPRLKMLQGGLDRAGVLTADVTSQEFLMATTIRDCSIYVKVINPFAYL
jgi:inositol-pentakisphosphate 2-kinase